MKKIKNIFKKNYKIIIAFIIGITLTGTGVYAATILYAATQVGFDNTTANLKIVGTNNSVTNVQEALDALYKKAEDAKPPCPFKLGDYFKLTPDVETFTIRKAFTGYTSDQTINIAGTSDTNGLRLWRVIDIHKDGSFDAVSEYVSSDVVYFTGATGYQYFVSTLQLIASQYAKSGYTIGTRMMGYGGQTPVIQVYSDKTACSSDTTCKTTTTYAFDGSTSTAPSTTSTSSPTSGTGQEYGGGVLGDTLYLKDYLLVRNVYKSDTSTYGTSGLKAYNVSSTSSVKGYWLASRRFSWSSASSFNFYGREIYANGFLDLNVIRNFNSSWKNSTYSDSVRPILTLKSGITTNGGSGTKTDPYTLS